MYDRKKMPNKSLRVGLVRLRMRCLQKKMVRLPCNPLFQRTCALFARDEWLDVAPAPPVRASRHPPCPRMLDEMAGPNTLHSYEVSLYSGESAGNASSASIISSTSCCGQEMQQLVCQTCGTTLTFADREGGGGGLAGRLRGIDFAHPTAKS